MPKDFVALILLLPFHYLTPWWIVRWDMKRLSPDRLKRCWNSASLGAAVFGFGPFCLPVHFVRAHGWLRGGPSGIAVTVASVVVPVILIDSLVNALVPG